MFTDEGSGLWGFQALGLGVLQAVNPEVVSYRGHRDAGWQALAI